MACSYVPVSFKVSQMGQTRFVRPVVPENTPSSLLQVSMSHDGTHCEKLKPVFCREKRAGTSMLLDLISVQSCSELFESARTMAVQTSKRLT